MMRGKVILITGATDGIGKHTAAELLRRGATLLLHGRNAERTRQVAKELESTTGNSQVHPLVADLSSLARVRTLAAEVQTSFDRLDVLINNAGTYMKNRELTEDGYEMTFAVNHLAHFLLTNLLLDHIKRSAPARIITVSSVAHTRGRLDFDNLQSERRFDPYGSYATSKLANVLFTCELADRLKGSNVTSNSLHPGVIATKLLRTGFNVNGASVHEGATTSIYLATSPNVEHTTGKYFAKSVVADSSPLARDVALRRRLWQVSNQLVGLG